MSKYLIPLCHAIAADGSFMSARDVSSPRDGLTALAHADSFNNSNFSVELSGYSNGYKDPTDIDALLEFLAPGVQVSPKFQFYKHDADSDYLIDTDDARAPGADFKAVRASGSMVDSSTQNRGLTMFIDKDNVRGIKDYQQIYTGRLTRRIKRNQLYAAILALSTGAANTAKTWNTSADPDADLISMVEGSGDAMGFNPNRVAFCGNSWTKRLLAVRGQDTAGARASLGLRDANEVAAYVGAAEGRVVSARGRVDGAAKAKIGGNVVIGFYAENGVGPEDPTALKRFWSPTDAGGEFAVYVDDTKPKFIQITVECYNRMVLTSTLGVKKLTIS